MADIIRKVDDVHLVAGNEVPADGTHRLMLDGQVVSLDLTNENFAQLENDLAPWFKVGTRPKGSQQPHHSGASKRAQNRDRNARMRAYADAHGISYRNADGKVQYNRELQRRFDEWEADNGPYITLTGRTSQE